MKYPRLLLLPALIAGASTLASAATLLEYDFDTTLPGPKGTLWDTIATTPGDPNTVFTTLADSGNVFGAGTGNTIGRFQDSGASSVQNVSFAIAPVSDIALTLSLDFYIVSAGASAGISFADSLGLNQQANAARRIAGASLNPVGVLSTETHYQGYLFYNGTAGDLEYWNPELNQTALLGEDSTVAFAYNVATNEWISLFPQTSDQAGNSIHRVSFYSSSGDTANILFDNLKVVDGLTVIPEPSTYALAGAAGLVGLLALRRRRSK